MKGIQGIEIRYSVSCTRTLKIGRVAGGFDLRLELLEETLVAADTAKISDLAAGRANGRESGLESALWEIA